MESACFSVLSTVSSTSKSERSEVSLAVRVSIPFEPKAASAAGWGFLILLSGAAQFAAFREQSHAVHQVLHGNDAHQAFTVHDRDLRDAGAPHFGQSVGQCLLAACSMEDADHGGLHVAVTLGSKILHNDLPRNDADHVGSADHRKIVLQRVQSLFQR